MKALIFPLFLGSFIERPSSYSRNKAIKCNFLGKPFSCGLRVQRYKQKMEWQNFFLSSRKNVCDSGKDMSLFFHHCGDGVDHFFGDVDAGKHIVGFYIVEAVVVAFLADAFQIEE